MKKLFEVHQKITFFVNEYRILKDAGGQQELAAYAKQKRMALREQFTLFADSAQQKVIATSKARSIMDFSPVFDIHDDAGKSLAVIKKEFKKSLLISTWSVYDPAMKKLLFGVSEKSRAVAIARRAWEFIPIVSEAVPFPLKFHFSVQSGKQLAGEYIKTTTFRDHYALYLKENKAKTLDERAWMVLAVLLDAMQSR